MSVLLAQQCTPMRSSRFYQNFVQTVGSVGEIILFLCGFFLGKEMFVTALIFLVIRVFHKIFISELMYRRTKSIVREESNNAPTHTSSALDRDSI